MAAASGTEVSLRLVLESCKIFDVILSAAVSLEGVTECKSKPDPGCRVRWFEGAKKLGKADLIINAALEKVMERGSPILCVSICLKE